MGGGGLISLARSQAREAAVSASETQMITIQKAKKQNQGRLKVAFRSPEGRLVHAARGKILYCDVPHTHFPWKTQQEENADLLRATLCLPKLSAIPRISPAGLHGHPKGGHFAGYSEEKSRHEGGSRKPPKQLLADLKFPKHQKRTDGVMSEIQGLKRQDKLRSKNLKMKLDLNAAPTPERKNSRAERMKTLEAKIVARCQKRDEQYTMPRTPPLIDEQESSETPKQTGLRFTVEKNVANVSIPIVAKSDSWLDDFLTRN